MEMDLESQTSQSGVIGKRKRRVPTYTRGKYKGQRKFPYGWNSKKYRSYYTSMYPRGSAESKSFWGPTWQEANQEQRLRRGVGRFKGEGGFWKDVGKWGARLGGAAIGALTGGPAGALKGYQKGAAISKFVGLGDYGVSTNQIVGGMGTNDQQQISVNNDSLTGDIILAQTEYLTNVTITTPAAPNPSSGSSEFAVVGYDLNPGLSTFPFLSQIASNFELYDWQGLMIQYKPTSGEFGSSSVSNSLGKVIIATKYGVDQDVDFRNAIEMQNYDYANSSKPSQGMIHGIETDNKQQLSEMMLVRNGVVDSKAPRILYDIGKLYVATEGIPYNGNSQTIVLGELWVTYRVRLSRAKLFGTLGETTKWYQLTGSSYFTTLGAPVGSLAVTVVSHSATDITIQLPSDISYMKCRVMVTCNSASFPSTFLTTTTSDVVELGTQVVSGNTIGRGTAFAPIVINNPAKKAVFLTLTANAGSPSGAVLFIDQVDPDSIL